MSDLDADQALRAQWIVTIAEACRQLWGDAPEAGAVDQMKVVHRFVDEAIAGGRADGLACEAGCSWCCHQKVAVRPVEALTIARSLRARAESSSWVEALQRDRSLASMSPTCVFLGTRGRCRIYEVRPLSCRGLHAFDASECESAEAQDGQVSICAASDAIAQGADAALEIVSIEGGFDAELCELASAVLIALQPDAEQRWDDGEDIFDSSRLD